MGKIYVGQIGVEINLNTAATSEGIDLSAATTKEIKYRKPSGATGSWTASSSGDILTYTTAAAATLDEAGRWLLQAHVAGTGYDALGEKAELNIYSPFE